MTRQREKNSFQHSYFKSLLAYIKQHGNSNNTEFNALCQTLSGEAEKYFADKITIDAFKGACKVPIEQTRAHLKGQESVLHLLSKWMLAIASLGTVVAYSSIKTRIETGQWACHFFKAPGEAVAQSLLSIVEAEFHPK